MRFDATQLHGNHHFPSEACNLTTLTIVFPVFNEEEVLPILLERLPSVLQSLKCDVRIVFVDDGSVDRTPILLGRAAEADPRIQVLRFSRNFGHQAAITAGLDYADSDVVVVMDADLQDPPELLREMLAKYYDGFDVVSAQRIRRDGESWIKRATASGFYSLMQRFVDPRLQPQVSDFRLFSRAAVLSIRRFREQHRFMRGLVAWLGLKEAIVPFRRPARAAGETKYPLWKMLRFAWTAISSFSALPLKACLVAGFGLTALGGFYSIYVIFETLFLGTTVRGWSSIICLMLLFHGMTLVAVGLMGDYVSRIYEEIKGRPLYVVAEQINIAHLAPERSIAIDASYRSLSNSSEHDAIDIATQNTLAFGDKS